MRNGSKHAIRIRFPEQIAQHQPVPLKEERWNRPLPATMNRPCTIGAYRSVLGASLCEMVALLAAWVTMILMFIALLMAAAIGTS
jgi:hypothetical protein